MNSMLKICRVGPLLGLITRWHLYRVSRHADAASRSVLPRERFRSLAHSAHRAALMSACLRMNQFCPLLRGMIHTRQRLRAMQPAEIFRNILESPLVFGARFQKK